MTSPASMTPQAVEVPDFRGMQALNAWLAGHDAGLLLAGPDPDSPQPLLHGIVRQQEPPPGTTLRRWDVVTVWLADNRGEGDGVREPRVPHPPPARHPRRSTHPHPLDPVQGTGADRCDAPKVQNVRSMRDPRATRSYHEVLSSAVGHADDKNTVTKGRKAHLAWPHATFCSSRGRRTSV